MTPSMSTSNEEEKEKDVVDKERMEDIHEIPYILLQDFNPMMLTSTVKKVGKIVVFLFLFFKKWVESNALCA